MFAVASFTHFDLDVRKGDELPEDHPMVTARPDLFTDSPPQRATTKKEAR
jgi:hypothetical protein